MSKVAREFKDSVDALQRNIEQVIIGKPEAIRLVIVGLLARGHILIEDVPGIGKTTLAHALARSLDCSFQRIQFTSDLLPGDILGVSVYNQHTHKFEFNRGPIFANVILADEINRTTPKTQSCLLEAMNERQVSIDGVTYKLVCPFIVLATQNPVEYHGTYPLPESQLDRFMLRVRIGYPPPDGEKEILRNQKDLFNPAEKVNPVIQAEHIIKMQEVVELIKVEENLIEYLMEIVSGTRTHDVVRLGVSPRGALHLLRASQALAFINGRDYCIPDDIKATAVPALSHRIILDSTMEPSAGVREDETVIEEILAKVPVPL